MSGNCVTYLFLKKLHKFKYPSWHGSVHLRNSLSELLLLFEWLFTSILLLRFYSHCFSLYEHLKTPQFLAWSSTWFSLQKFQHFSFDSFREPSPFFMFSHSDLNIGFDFSNMLTVTFRRFGTKIVIFVMILDLIVVCTNSQLLSVFWYDFDVTMAS